MITVRLQKSTERDLQTIGKLLHHRLGCDFTHTDIVRYCLRRTLRQMRRRPETLFEVKRCDGCDGPLALHNGDGADQLYCPQCEEFKS